MYSFRKALMADFSAMLAIENAAGFNHWTSSQLQDSVLHHCVYIAEYSTTVSGFAIFTTVLDEADLLNIVVVPEQQGKGIGKALLLHGLQDLLGQSITQCTLEVGVSNKPAIHLYQQCGFSLIGQRKNYYQHNNLTEDAMVMQLQLKEMVCRN